ncbi:MAG: DUF6164 family protein [Gammaproteobacteria bacterium]|jgi:hypothetical protein|nr:DUF6164 family protein [Gammaproteobacteria bacterium]
MARKVYDTNQASSEEISDILALLQRHAISHYETPKGVFGLSLGAIWVENDADYDTARQIIEEYDKAHALRVRQQYGSAAQGTGLVATLLNVRRLIVERPHQALLYALIIAGLIAIHWWFFKALSG